MPTPAPTIVIDDFFPNGGLVSTISTGIYGPERRAAWHERPGADSDSDVRGSGGQTHRAIDRYTAARPGKTMKEGA